jgi:hypothetical protein
MHGFRNQKAFATPHTHIWAGSDLPIELKENTYLLLSPYYEQWNIDSADQQDLFPVVQSVALPLGLILPLDSGSWTLMVLPVLRSNGETLFEDNTFQIGGAVLTTFARRSNQKFRFGAYINTEFFGFYFLPLIGTDWRIDDRNNLFGVLPGRLTFEHQLADRFYCGVTFRAITNSYRLSTGEFLRVKDNQLSVFLDYYLTKSICMTLETGYGILRKVRTGVHKKEYLTEHDWGDSPFVKISTSYRIRLD